ncbi:hypothetical protein ABPG72_017655, partial [Tetrahymena utriculariae]
MAKLEYFRFQPNKAAKLFDDIDTSLSCTCPISSILALKKYTWLQTVIVPKEQLSELENIKKLSYDINAKIDISTSFIGEIVNNKHLQELEIRFSHLEQDYGYEFENDQRGVSFIKDLNSIKQTSLQKLIINIDCYHCKGSIKNQFEILGKYLSTQK